MGAWAVSSAPTEELLTKEEAKRHLRLLSNEWDDEIATLIAAARDDCERFTGRTFRTAVSRTYKTDQWWTDPFDMPWPPLIGVTSITYYDEDNVQQTYASSNYYVELSTNSKGRLVWQPDITLPNLYDRPDAITLTITTGYASLSAVPPVAVQAIKTKLTELWAAGTESELRAATECTKRLLYKVDESAYA